MRTAAIVGLWLLPLLLPATASLYLAANCEDDWCPGAQLELWTVILGAGIIVGATQWALMRRGTPPARAGLAGWTLSLAIVFGLVAFSQFYENDPIPGMAAAWTAAALLVAAFVLGRTRRRPVATEKLASGRS
ncbi:MAG TPA: hypothetical protein VI818_00425 [Candidatus Thermoplasmatota archaeon]|nr:hypothetical protein [Candidatus Thermoplasmatota archaeon]